MAVSIPPWLNVGPLDPVQFYSQGIQFGQRAAAERNQNIMQSAQLAAQATESAARDRRADQAAAADAVQFAASLAERKKQNELAAREAALQYEGMVGFERDVADGIAPEQAILRNPGMFRRNMTAMASAYKALTPEPAFKPRIMDIDGVRVMQTGPKSYRPLPAEKEAVEGPIAAEPITTPKGDVLGYGVRGASGGVHPLRQDRGDMTPYQRAQILKAELTAALQEREGFDANSQDYKAVSADITALRRELGALRKAGVADTDIPAPSPSKAALTKEKAMEFLQQAGGNKEKARQLARDAGYEW